MVLAWDEERRTRSEGSVENGDTGEEEERTTDNKVEGRSSEGHANHRTTSGRGEGAGHMERIVNHNQTTPDDGRSRREEKNKTPAISSLNRRKHFEETNARMK